MRLRRKRVMMRLTMMAHQGSHKQPTAASSHGSAHQLLTGAVEREAAGDQDRGVDDRQQHLQFVDGPGRQWVDGSEGEVCSKEAGKGHGIGDQKSG